jgi:hypothetical protein
MKAVQQHTSVIEFELTVSWNCDYRQSFLSKPVSS